MNPTHAARYPARLLALAWQATRLAAATEKERPVLYRTTALEVFDGRGIRLTSTNTFALLSTFVPTLENLYDPSATPGLDEAPDGAFVVADVDNRLLGMMRYVSADIRRIITDADGDNTAADYVWLELERRRAVADALTLGIDVDPMEWVGNYGNAETVAVADMGTVAYPDIRPIVLGHQPKQVTTFGLSAVTIDTVTKLAKLLGTPIACTMSGPDGLIRLAAPEFDALEVVGGIMPARIELGEHQAAA